jgi:hypothetical protein
VAASKQSVAGLTASISVQESERLSRLMAGDMSLYHEDRSTADFDKRMVTLTRTKNGRAHHIPLNAAALAAFRSLRAEHGKQAKDSPVFPNGSGEAVHTTR